jgi:PAS domain S-box-containing protein
MGNRTTVLHVDDEPRFGELTRTFLERENEQFVVETVTSADAGLERVDDCPPDCVVSDYNMPGMDGLAFLQAVRDTHPDLPFILFTGKGSEEVASDAIAAGVTDYIQKGSGSERYALLANRIENAVESRREAKRADRQEQLMRLTEFAGDTGGFELDTETGEVVMTDGTRRILNLPEQANPDFERNLRHYHPDDREKIRQTVQRALQTGEQTRATLRYQHPDAEEKLVEITYTPVTANGDTTTIRGAVCDVTDRRERQRELRQLQQAIDDANVPITLADPSREDDPLVYVNNGFEEMTGYAPEEARGRNCRFLQGEDTDPEKVAALREATDNEESISVELRNYRKNGTEFWNRLTVSPIYDDDDNLVRYLGTQEDITERKERERELGAERRRFRALVEESNDIISVIDAAGVFQYQSPSIERILGYDPEETIGDTAWEYMHPDDRTELVEAFERWIDQPDANPVVEYRARHADGSWRWLEARGNNQLDNPAVEGYVINSRDVTEQTEREQRLSTQNKRLDEFASIVSHDLRTPLGVAEGHLELAQDTCESKHLAKAANAIDRSRTLIDDLSTLAREGKAVAEVEPVALADVAESSWQTTETGSATLEIDTAQAIRADRSRLQELFENLYRNAVKHGGDDVTVSVEQTSSGFCVSDTGSGVPETEREAVFEAGYSTDADGTGFGLRIVEQIAEAHGWDVAVGESAEGGARFEFTGDGLAD